MWTLYSYYRSSAAWRVRLGLARKSLPHRLVPIHLRHGEQGGADYRRINPAGLESPAIHDLLGTDETARRRAAASLLAAPAWVVYKVDLVNAPMALGIKELKIGTIGARAIRFNTKTALPECVEIFYFQNDQQKSDYAISKSDRAIIDPAIAKMLRDDLAAQYLTHAPKAPAPPAK